MVSRPEDSENSTIAEALEKLKGHTVNWETLKALSQEEGSPLSYLPLAFDMLDHDTGNIFLDPTDEMPVEPLEWCLEDLDYLIEQYREATTILNNTQKLLDWLCASPSHLEEVVQLWNQALS